MRLRSYIGVVALTSSICAAAEKTITVSCEPKVTAQGMVFGKHASRSSLSATLQPTNFEPSFGRGPQASVGFYQVGEDSREKIEFFVTQHREMGFIVAGYRLRDRRRKDEIEVIDKLPVSASVQVIMKIDDGLVTLLVPPLNPIEIKTTLGVVGHSASTACGVSLEITYDP